jgi:hypothetical protein
VDPAAHSSEPNEEVRPLAGGWWLLATGLVLISAASTWQRDSAEMPREALRLPAQVVSIETRVREHPAGNTVLYAPKVRFTRPDGRQVEFISAVWKPSVRHLERQPVDVLFDPLTGLAIIDTRSGAYSAYALLGGLGALLLGIGVRRLATPARARLQGPGDVTPA